MITTIRGRVEAVLDFLRSQPEIDRAVEQAVRRRLECVVAATFPLERRAEGPEELVRRVQASFTWAERQGVSWPP